MQNTDTALKGAGYRLTTPRKHIFGAVSAHPQTIQQISETLTKNNIKHDLATLYRTLELFVTLNLVTKIQLSDNAARYELANTEHHHHLVCDTCGKIEDIPVQEDTFLKEISEKTAFQIKRHSLEFFGFCIDCQ